MSGYLKIHETDIRDKFVISGVIGYDGNQTPFILKRKQALWWVLSIKIQDGQYFPFKEFPIQLREETNEYPGQIMTWIFNHANLVMQEVEKRREMINIIGKIELYDRVEVEIIEEYLDKTQSSYVKGKITSFDKAFYFNLTKISLHEPWILFVNKLRNYPGTDTFCEIPEFNFDNYEDRSIINWIGKNFKELAVLAHGLYEG